MRGWTEREAVRCREAIAIYQNTVLIYNPFAGRMKRDPHFGALLMFGLGGIYVEVLKDVTFRIAPIRELEGADRDREVHQSSIAGGDGLSRAVTRESSRDGYCATRAAHITPANAAPNAARSKATSHEIIEVSCRPSSNGRSTRLHR